MGFSLRRLLAEIPAEPFALFNPFRRTVRRCAPGCIAPGLLTWSNISTGHDALFVTLVTGDWTLQLDIHEGVSTAPF